MRKTILKNLLLALMLFIGSAAFSQDPPPPPPGGHGNNNNQPPGGSAPIEGGALFLTTLAVAYGTFKGWNSLKAKQNQAKL